MLSIEYPKIINRYRHKCGDDINCNEYIDYLINQTKMNNIKVKERIKETKEHLRFYGDQNTENPNWKNVLSNK
jgi:hypothetical protein